MYRYIGTTMILLYAVAVCPTSASIPRGVNLADLAGWSGY